MKLFKLWVHQHTFSEDELIINPKEFPDGRVGDVLEIFHPEDQGSERLLLQINSISDFQQKDTVSIEQAVANLFQLRTYSNVNVKKVDPDEVSVDLVDVLVKDQYVSRNDMWRLSKALVGKCVYVPKKVSFSGIRGQINELWTNGEQKTCGVISKDTRVVFRSLTAEIFLFIQMSQEMWDFDLNGDLYFEKVINGFLRELFTKWKEVKANHEVTIVLFSRTYYDCKSEDDFPTDKRSSILQDPYGRFHEDFYQVVVHEDRRDDWLPVLVTLKYHFNQYPKYINSCQDIPGMPKGNNSTAFGGNFLQAINLTMNIFEKHNLDRNFDRTGQTIVLVTPGPGVFEVDRTLNSITKQRMVDSGVAVDLVCMAEQPLHSVPLLKFYNKDADRRVSLGDDYNIPHWINHSFFTSPKTKYEQDTFRPRIKIPDVVLNCFGVKPEDNQYMKDLHKNFHPRNAKDHFANQLPDFIDYDEYDANIFRTGTSTKQRAKNLGRTKTSRSVPLFSRPNSSSDLEKLNRSRDDSTVLREFSPRENVAHGAISVPSLSKSLLRHSQGEIPKHRISSSMDYTIYSQLSSGFQVGNDNENAKDEFFIEIEQVVVGSAGAPRHFPGFHSRVTHDYQRTLFNPFKPLDIPCRWTCNRHRWAHCFPKGPDGESIHRHFERLTDKKDEDTPQKSKVAEQAARAIVDSRKRAITDSLRSEQDEPEDADDAEVAKFSLSSESDEKSFLDSLDKHETPPGCLVETPPMTDRGSSMRRPRAQARASFFHHTLDKVQHDWTAAIKTSVDWESLVLPACLPLTSEYCPDMKTLESDYLEFHYELCVGDDDEYALSRLRSTSNASRLENQSRHPVTVESMALELVAQRLSKGFQILINPPYLERCQSFPAFISQDDEFESEDFFLSLGRNIHRLSVFPKRSQINVTRYRPRHVQGTIPIHYRYRLWVSHAKQYHYKEAEFQHDELDKYNWNYLDQHISGEQDFTELVESLRYWKSRLLLLPVTNQKKYNINEGKEDDMKVSHEETYRVEGILKYLELLNGLKRSKARRRPFSPKAAKAHSRSRTPEPKKEQQVATQEVASKKDEKNAGSSSTPTEKEATENHTNSSQDNSSETVGSTTNVPLDSSQEDILNTNSPLETIAEAMLDESNGFQFLPSTKGLGTTCFLSIEAVWWMMHNIKGLDDRREAISLAQKMVDAKIFQHASGSTQHKFIYGFTIFFITPKEKWNEKEETTERKRSQWRYSSAKLDQSLREFQENWFEVVIGYPKSPSSRIPAFLVPDEDVEEHLKHSPSFQQALFSRRGRTKSTTQNPMHEDCGCGAPYKTVNINCDVQRKSERPEWAVIRYHGNYCSTHAFEVEVHWIETTGTVVSDLIQGWARKATSCGFHLIPVPVSPFPDPLGCSFNPFRLPVYVPVLMNACQDQNDDNIFQGFDSSTYRLRMFLFLEAILENFGFIRDSPYGSSHSRFRFFTPPIQCRAADYVHSSGALFVRIHDQESATSLQLYGFSPGDELPEGKNVGFFCTHNYMLTKRWRSAATGDVESSRKLMEEFEDFCSNKNGALKDFWDKSKDFLLKAKEGPREDESIVERNLDDSIVCEDVSNYDSKQIDEEINTRVKETTEKET